jgi:hypothetical protein
LNTRFLRYIASTPNTNTPPTPLKTHPIVLVTGPFLLISNVEYRLKRRNTKYVKEARKSR